MLEASVLLSALSLFALAGANTGAVVEGVASRVSFPVGWSKLSGSTPMRVQGPDRTVVTISETLVTGNANDAGAESARQNIIAACRQAVGKAISASGMRVQMPWRETSLTGGLRFQETIATSSDSLSYLANILVVGRRGVLFFTVEGPASAINRYPEVRAASQAVAWK